MKLWIQLLTSVIVIQLAIAPAMAKISSANAQSMRSLDEELSQAMQNPRYFTTPQLASQRLFTRLGLSAEFVQDFGYDPKLHTFARDPELAELILKERYDVLSNRYALTSIHNPNPIIQEDLRTAASHVRNSLDDAYEFILDKRSPIMRRWRPIRPPGPLADQHDVALLDSYPDSIKQPIVTRLGNGEYQINPLLEESEGMPIREGLSRAQRFGGAVRTFSGGVAATGIAYGGYVATMELMTIINCYRHPESNPLCGDTAKQLLWYYMFSPSQIGGFASWALAQGAVSAFGSGRVPAPILFTGAMTAGMLVSNELPGIIASPMLGPCLAAIKNGFTLNYLNTGFGGNVPVLRMSKATMENMDTSGRRACNALGAQVARNFVEQDAPSLAPMLGASVVMAGGARIASWVGADAAIANLMRMTNLGRTLLGLGETAVGATGIGLIVSTVAYATLLETMQSMRSQIGGPMSYDWWQRWNRSSLGWGLNGPTIQSAQVKLNRQLTMALVSGIKNAKGLNVYAPTLAFQKRLDDYHTMMANWRSDRLNTFFQLHALYTEKLAPLWALDQVTAIFYREALLREAVRRLLAENKPVSAEFMKRFAFADDIYASDQKFVQDFTKRFPKLALANRAQTILNSGGAEKLNLDKFENLSVLVHDIGPYLFNKKNSLLDYLIAMSACGPNASMYGAGYPESVIRGGGASFDYFVPPRLIPVRPAICTQKSPVTVGTLMGLWIGTKIGATIPGVASYFKRQEEEAFGPSVYDYKWKDQNGIEHRGLLSYVMAHLSTSVLNINQPAQPGSSFTSLERSIQPFANWWSNNVNHEVREAQNQVLNMWRRYLAEQGLQAYTTRAYQYCYPVSYLNFKKIDCTTSVGGHIQLAIGYLYNIRDEIEFYDYWIRQFANQLSHQRPYGIDAEPLYAKIEKLNQLFRAYMKNFRKLANDVKPSSLHKAGGRDAAITDQNRLENDAKRLAAQAIEVQSSTAFFQNALYTSPEYAKDPSGENVVTLINYLGTEMTQPMNELVTQTKTLIPVLVDNLLTQGELNGTAK